MHDSYVVMGVDGSSKKLAIVATRNGDLDHPVTTVLSLTKKNWSTDCSYQVELLCDAFLRGLVCVGDSRFAFVEGPVVAGVRNLQATIKQSMVNGAVQQTLLNWGFEVEIVPPKTWIKETTGKGNASKEDIGKSIRDRWSAAYDCAGEVSADHQQDVLDAAGLHLYGFTKLTLAGRVG